MTSQILVPEKRIVLISNTYADLAVPRVIANNNPLRGLIIFSVTDSLDPTRPRRWEIALTGGFSYVGDGSKYFPIDGTFTNVVSITPTVPGYEYNLDDAFGNTYHLIFNGARDFNPTIELTAGVLTGDVILKSFLVSYTDVPPR